MADLDFYTRGDGQDRFIEDVLEVTDDLSLLIEQIENCLFTKKKQVLGQEKFGINLEDLIFTFSKNESELKREILNQIYAYCPLARRHPVDVQVMFKSTPVRDIGFIDIYIDYKKTFGIVI